MMKTFARVCLSGVICFVFAISTWAASPAPKPPGRLVDLGGHKLHVNCTGKGTPTVVIENGLGDFSFDWILVQGKVSSFSRVCTYDRGGYAWSDPGPQPRTFAQLNLELHDALAKLKEQGPFLLVGHSFGGPVVRNFALLYPHDVAGIVFVDAAHEGMRVGVGGRATIRLGEDAKGRSIPPPHESMKSSDRPPTPPPAGPQPEQPLDALYQVLPPAEQKMHLWAQALPEIDAAENSQREWSGEYYAKQLASPQAGTLGSMPVIVLTRADGGFGNDQDVPAAQQEKERKESQAKLAQLSTNSRQILVHSGHNMELEAPDEVVAAIREVVQGARHATRM
jgi:pimeloyl-ACP methyl ester carboxylesterase